MDEINPYFRMKYDIFFTLKVGDSKIFSQAWCYSMLKMSFLPKITATFFAWNSISLDWLLRDHTYFWITFHFSFTLKAVRPKIISQAWWYSMLKWSFLPKITATCFGLEYHQPWANQAHFLNEVYFSFHYQGCWSQNYQPCMNLFITQSVLPTLYHSSLL